MDTPEAKGYGPAGQKSLCCWGRGGVPPVEIRFPSGTGVGAMLRKTLFYGVVAVLLLCLLFGRDGLSYLTTVVDDVRQSVRQKVPTEFELRRARKMLAELEPIIRQNRRRMVEEEVRLEQLADRIARLEEKLRRDQAEILMLRDDLAEKRRTYVYAGRTYTAEEVRQDLEHRFQRFKTNQSTLEHLRRVYQARKRSLDALGKQLQGMIAAQGQLRLEVENLAAQLEMVKAAETMNRFQFDDSHLARLKTLVRDLQTRIHVAARMADQEHDAYAEIPVHRKGDSGDIVDQVTRYFDESRQGEGG